MKKVIAILAVLVVAFGIFFLVEEDWRETVQIV